MKWGFVILTAFSDPFGAELYVLGCKEPRRGTHEKFVEARWRQVVGSTAHCVAGDGIGIFAAASVTGLLRLSYAPSVIVEYLAGFLFGWTIFQSLFMKSSMGGSYRDSLRSPFLAEFLSMNGVMAGMTAVMITWMTKDPLSKSPLHPMFWFVMSMTLCAGFVVACPINWWLVSRGLKHGMMTERPEGYTPPRRASETVMSGGHSSHAMAGTPSASSGTDHSAMTSVMPSKTSPTEKLLASVVSLGILGVGSSSRIPCLICGVQFDILETQFTFRSAEMRYLDTGLTLTRRRLQTLKRLWSADWPHHRSGANRPRWNRSQGERVAALYG